MSCAKACHARHLYKLFTGLSAHCRYGLHVSTQRVRAAVEPSHRSIHPNIPGVPWWAALLIALAATAIGYVIDSGHKELTHVFAGLYVAGCVAAVLAVRQSGVFTAVIQPPLILFCAVPGAYWLFHDGKVGRLKDLLINCGYPLIERFPLMLGTAGAVLLIGLIRWYFGMSHQATKQTAETGADTDTAAGSGATSALLGGIGDKLNSLLGLKGRVREADDEDDDAEPKRPKRARPAGSGRPTRGDRGSASGSSRTRSRQGRPPLDEDAEAPAERPRRRRPPPSRDYEDPSRRSRRRPRPPADPDARDQAPREPRREPRSRRSPYERPAPRSNRSYDRYEPAPEPFDPYEKPYDSYDSYEGYERPRRRSAPNGSGGGSTHHPVSRVRYRGEPLEDDPRPTRSRNGRSSAESWEYDI
jgi:hypothetical protein